MTQTAPQNRRATIHVQFERMRVRSHVKLRKTCTNLYYSVSLQTFKGRNDIEKLLLSSWISHYWSNKSCPTFNGFVRLSLCPIFVLYHLQLWENDKFLCQTRSTASPYNRSFKICHSNDCTYILLGARASEYRWCPIFSYFLYQSKTSTHAHHLKILL